MNAFLISPFTAASYSAPVTTFLGSGDQVAMRTALGLGTADSPTFLGLSLAGQSVTGAATTPLLDLSATWATTGAPTALKVNVTGTSNAAALLFDYQVGGVSSLKYSRTGVLTFGSQGAGAFSITMGAGTNVITFSGNHDVALPGLRLTRDPLVGGVIIGFGANIASLHGEAPNVIIQRNGSFAQNFLLANSVGASPTTDYDRAVFGWSAANVLRIGTENAGTYGTVRGIDFVTGGVVRLSIHATTGAVGALGGVYTYRDQGFVWSGSNSDPFAAAQLTLRASAAAANMLCIGGVTNLFPALKRSTTAIQARLADDTAFTTLQGKITTDSAYTAGASAATGFITIFDSTGTAYRVFCSL